MIDFDCLIGSREMANCWLEYIEWSPCKKGYSHSHNNNRCKLRKPMIVIFLSYFFELIGFAFCSIVKKEMVMKSF